MYRKIAVLLAIIMAHSLTAQTGPSRIPLVMTGEQQQQLRAMSAEMAVAQRDEQKAKEDQAKLFTEREQWVRKIEESHPGYKLVPDKDGLYLELVAAKKESR